MRAEALRDNDIGTDRRVISECMIAIGRDLENVVLSRAVRYHFERCVLVNGEKTVVFR